MFVEATHYSRILTIVQRESVQLMKIQMVAWKLDRIAFEKIRIEMQFLILVCTCSYTVKSTSTLFESFVESLS